MWHQQEYPSAQHNSVAPWRVPPRTLQCLGRLWRHRSLTSSCKRETHARKPLLADEWKCDLAPRIRCLVLLPHCLLHCFWGSQRRCHHTEAILCERGGLGNPSQLQRPSSLLRATWSLDTLRLMDCHYAVRSMEISWPTYFSCFFFLNLDLS